MYLMSLEYLTVSEAEKLSESVKDFENDLGFI